MNRRFFAALLLLLMLAGGMGLADEVEATEAPTAVPTLVPTAPPVESADLSLEVVLGFDGLLGMGRSMPATVSITNHGADLADAVLGVNVFKNTVAYDRYEQPFSLAKGATKRFTFAFTPTTRQDFYGFEVVVGGTIVAEQRVTPVKLVPPEAMLVGILSANPQALTYFSVDPTQNPALRSETWTAVALSSENFPSDLKSMQALSILVVDGVDVRTLSDDQRGVLVSWLSDGGMIILGGGTQAHVNYPYFAPWTSLEAGALEQVEDFTPALIEFGALTQKPVGLQFYRNKAQGNDQALVAQEDEGLLYLTRVGKGALLTATFDLSTKPMATWPGARLLWQRVLVTAVSDIYTAELNRVQSSMYNSYNYNVQSVLSQMPLAMEDNVWWVYGILGLYVLLMGFGAYLLLKRLDKREWMWLTVPLCALAATAALLMFAQGIRFNEPAAVSTAQITIGAETSQAVAYIGVATAETGELLLHSEQPFEVYTSENYYYDHYTGTNTEYYRPLQLDRRYVLGDRPTIGIRETAPWSMVMLQAQLEDKGFDQLQGTAWLEADGLHGIIENGSPLPLEAGYVFTPFGYALVDPLLPGQSAEFFLANSSDDPSAVDYYVDYYNMKPNILHHMPTGSAYFYVDSYGLMRSAIYGITTDDTTGHLSSPAMSRQEQQELTIRYNLASMCVDSWETYRNPAFFHYVAFNDAYGRVAVDLGMEEITRTSHKAILDLTLRYEPIGPTGEVYYPMGMLLPEFVSGREPYNTLNGQLTGNSYLPLGEPVELRYALPEGDSLVIETMSLMVEYYDPLTLWLYNYEAEAWVAQSSASLTLTGEKWAPYLDPEDNSLLVRYGAASSSQYYGDLQVPRLTLKGKVN